MIHNLHLEGKPFYWKAGPVGILLTHGFTATTAEVHPLASRLHRLGFSIAAPLLPGHGSRPETLNKIHWRDWVFVAQDCYQRLSQSCEYIFLGGESTGALVALYLASQHHLDITGILTYAPALVLTYSRLQRFLVYLAAPFIPYLRKPNWTPNPLWQGYEVYPLKGTLQLFRFQQEVRKRLTKIRQPILVVQGRYDSTVHPDVPELIYQSVRSTLKEIHWMEKSGHIVILDQELDQVTQVTLDFIDRSLKAIQS